MPLRAAQLVVAALFACLLLWLTFGFGTSNPTPLPLEAPIPDASQKNELPSYNIPPDSPLAGHGGIDDLTNPHIQMAQVHITVSQSDITPLSLMQPLGINLPASTQITVTDNFSDPNAVQPVPASTTVSLPYFSNTPPDASEFIFGVATTYERLYDSLDTMAHWLGGTNSRLIAVLAPSLDLDLPDKVLAKARELKVPLGTIESRYEFLDRYFSLLQILPSHALPTTKWYVFTDDDTFFPDLSNLIATFNQKYNSSQPLYVGALTEDFVQMTTWGYMAYGGGGIFLSKPLVDVLQPHYDECFKLRDTGDHMVAGCIQKHTTTRFTWDPNLHQLDLHGDQSGFYEALRSQPLSLHHWKSAAFKSDIDMHQLSLVSSVCGNACILQKFRFKDNWVLTNGFSLVKYSDQDMHHRDISTDISMERTWDLYWPQSGNVHFEHSLGPIRKPDENGKITYRMESAVAEEGKVRQLYVKRKKREEPGEENQHGEVEGVVEIIWTLAA